MTLREWKREYSSNIRVVVDFKKLGKIKVGMKLCDGETEFVLPWYKGKSWKDGEPEIVKIGDGRSLVRLPAIKLEDNKFFMPDGCHRLTTLKPRFVVLDYLEVEKLRYFTDLHNRYNRGYWDDL